MDLNSYVNHIKRLRLNTQRQINQLINNGSTN